MVRREGATPTLQAKGLEFSVDHVFDQGQAECYEQGVRERVCISTCTCISKQKYYKKHI